MATGPAATAEKARKMTIIANLADQGLTKSQIARETGFPEGTVGAYLHQMRKAEKELAKTMDPEVLAEKKADVISGLLYDLTLVHKQIAKSQKGYAILKTTKKGDYEVVTVNEMAIAALIKQSVDIRMKIAELYGLKHIEITTSGEIKHVFEVKSAMPPPSAMREIPMSDN